MSKIQHKTVYFHVINGSPLEDKLVSIHKEFQDFQEAGRELVRDLGAETAYMFNGQWSVFSFNEEPCRETFKKARGGRWAPRKNAKGQALQARIDEIGTFKSEDDQALTAAGLDGIMVVNGFSAYRPTYTTTLGTKNADKLPLLMIFSVPWFDETPEHLELLEQYRKDDKRYNSNLTYYLRKPDIFTNPDVRLIEKWEAEKLVSDHQKAANSI